MTKPAQQSTRERIMSAAEELFASRGVDAVSMNEINKAAGQKNTSSLHYHFGGKDGLIQAIVYSHYEEIEEKLQASLKKLAEMESYDIDLLVDYAITPFIDKLDSHSGINYILIVTQLLNKSADMLIVGHPDKVDKARSEMLAVFEQLVEGMPDNVKVARLILFSGLLFHSLASYAKFEQADSENLLGDKAFFKNNLHETLKAMVQAPY